MTLACHTWLLKWHAQVKNGEWRATPLIPSGTPHLACHASAFKWHAIVTCLGWRATPSIPSGTPSLQFPSAPSLDYCTSVPRHAVQVARPWICELFRLGVPRLGSQVARPSDFLELAYHAFDTKWHAMVEVLLGMVS
ncbi:uncharacterized protein DS421_15g504510 [Arachis hypogaea]|nr:uncharacterized protein DS421_15g504510 [Arachis hypogaea]